MAFRRVLQTAVLHVQSAQREEVKAGDILAAILQQPKTPRGAAARRRRASRGSTSSNYISHGIAKVPAAGDAASADAVRGAGAGDGDDGPATRARSARRLLRRT